MPPHYLTPKPKTKGTSRDGQDHHLLVILKIKIRSIQKCDLEDQRSDHPHTVILKIKNKITLLLVLKER